MITLPGMAEHMFNTVYNYQHFTLLWYKIGMAAIPKKEKEKSH